MSTAEARQPRFSMLNVGEVSREDANRLLEEWDHPLGPCRRPFGQQSFVLDVAGQPVALAVSASMVAKHVVNKDRVVLYRRNQVVELARVARHPDHRFVLRPFLRLYREYLAPTWPYFQPAAAISYAMPGTKGDLYRFDGWEFVRRCEISRGGGTWTYSDPKVSQIADGVKSLWLWRYDDPGAGQ